MRKQFKNALSIVLSAAMVLTGGGIGAMTSNTAEAAGTIQKIPASLKGSYEGADVITAEQAAEGFKVAPTLQSAGWYSATDGMVWEITGNGDYALEVPLQQDGTIYGNGMSQDDLDKIVPKGGGVGGFWVDANYNVPGGEKGKALSTEGVPVFSVDSITIISGTESTSTKIDPNIAQFCYSDQSTEKGMRYQVKNPWGWRVDTDALTALDGGSGKTANLVAGEYINGLKSDITWKTGDKAIIHLSVSGMKNDKPVDTTGAVNGIKNFTASLDYSADGAGKDDGVGTAERIVGDGSYAVTYTAKSDSDDINSLKVNTNLYGDAGADFKIEPTAVRVAAVTATTPAVYPVDAAKASVTKSDAQTAYALAVRDPKAATAVDALNAQKIPVKAGDEVSVYFKVSGTGLTSKTATADPGYVATPTPEPTATPSPAPATPEPTPASVYHAYMGFQTDMWAFRDAVNSDNGMKSKNYDFTKQIGVNGGAKACDVAIQDAEITKNDVEYSVKISGMNLNALEEAGKTSQGYKSLFISTDIPTKMKDVKATKATLKIDGEDIATYDVMPTKSDQDSVNGSCYLFEFIDSYDTGLYKDAAGKDAYLGKEDITKSDKKNDTIGLLKDGTPLNGKSTSLKGKVPKDSIEMTFTVSGIDFAADYTPQTIGTKKGKTFTAGNYKYKVTTAAKSTAGEIKAGKVQVTALSSKGKKKTSLSLAKSVSKTVSGSAVSYKITSIGAKVFSKNKKVKTINLKKATNVSKLPAKAFAKSTKLKTVTFNSKMKLPADAFNGCTSLNKLTLNKKMTSIPKNAFKGCKKLSSLKLSAKIKKAAKNAFKGCKKKIKVSAKAKIKKASIKALKKSGYKKFK